MQEVRIDIDIRKIAPPKWYYVFLPWRWAHFFIYKKRKLRAEFHMETPRAE